jgi:hypothetical protein
MFSTIEELLEESKRLAETQPFSFRETLTSMNLNAVAPSIQELINIVSESDQRKLVSTTRI